MRAFSYAWSHQSRDKHGGHMNRSAVARNPICITHTHTQYDRFNDANRNVPASGAIWRLQVKINDSLLLCQADQRRMRAFNNAWSLPVTPFDPPWPKTPCRSQTLQLYVYRNEVIANDSSTLQG